MDKTCFKCNRLLPLSEFYKHPAMGDGTLGKCKSCTRSDNIANRLSRIEYYRAYDRERAKQSKRKANAHKVSTRWRKSDKRHDRAHNMIIRAIRKGQIQRKPCEVCGALKSHAHHDNYDFPLDVIFLCATHHKERHKMLKAEGRNP